jgi:hydrogenase maturation protease
MNPVNVLRMAAAMNAPIKRVLLVGCEPSDLGGDEGHMGLSASVEAAVPEAVKLVAELINRILREDRPNITHL